MKLRIYLITTAIAFLLALGAFFIDQKLAFGILLSGLYSLVNMLMLSFSMKAALASAELNFGALVFGNIIRFGLLMVVIYIAVRNPQIFNMIGVAAGFVLFFIALLIDALSRRGKDKV